ncbi:MAG: cytochrome c-type biogenesis protein CcmH [Hyphomicrobiales bacterium]|nr:cytochrome c-type biogenesis protein CcmH [Hyphomicrobiales bacterium]
MSRAVRALSVFVAVLLFVFAMPPVPAIAIDADEILADPVQEARARDIGKGLRCLVCRNQSIFDSNASLARDLRVLVRERVQAGDDDDAVKAYVVDRYGDFVLLNPPVKPLTYVLWLAPALLVLGAFFLGHRYLRGRAVAARQRPEPLSPEDRAAARRLLEGEG